MKQFVAIIITFACSVITSTAQSFMDNLKKKGRDNATVTVHQDAAIDELVNGKAWSTFVTAQKAESATTDAGNTSKPSVKTPLKSESTAANSKTESADTEYGQITRPKTYKTIGYRVQVYAGGNNKNARQTAQRTGNAIKINFPDEQVYVNFFSPRWICRVGNYRSYEEAHQMLIAVKQLGYNQATIVKGKITVQF